MTTKIPIEAIAVFDTKKITGFVYFTEDLINNNVIIDIHIEGLTKNGLHGFHIHEYGDISEQCESLCLHFNPYGKKHGCPGASERHAGDLGNLITNQNGIAHYQQIDNIIKLRGSKANIIGRGLIIHAGVDDCGLGENKESFITGNSGKRIACAIIGYAKQK